VRLPLLLDTYPRYDRGILDRTHLQWFTRKRVRELIAATPPLTLQQLTVSIEPVEFVFPTWFTNSTLFRTLRKIHLRLAQTLPGFWGYQHLAAARILFRNSV
jgi:hypothetical protein